MAGLKGKSGPPGNMNAFKHGFAAIQKRREESLTTEHQGFSFLQKNLAFLSANVAGFPALSSFISSLPNLALGFNSISFLNSHRRGTIAVEIGPA